jgi:Mn2+/Fe2+ NRAMP family transporter
MTALTRWQKLRPFRVRLLLLLSVISPGIITANVDNDAGGITTYSVAGVHYGYTLLWMLTLVILALIIVQEMSARLGIVTGKGLSGLIRENLGVRWTTIIIGILLIANLANTVSEFAGLAAILPLSTSYAVCEAFGFESAVNRSWREAPIFFGIYTGIIVLGAGIILLRIKSLIDAMLSSQTLNGVLLPVILLVMLRLINDKRLMGRFTNGWFFNIVSWAMVIALIALRGILVVTSIFPNLLSGAS